MKKKIFFICSLYLCTKKYHMFTAAFYFLRKK